MKTLFRISIFFIVLSLSAGSHALAQTIIYLDGNAFETIGSADYRLTNRKSASEIAGLEEKNNAVQTQDRNCTLFRYDKSSVDNHDQAAKVNCSNYNSLSGSGACMSQSEFWEKQNQHVDDTGWNFVKRSYTFVQ